MVLPKLKLRQFTLSFKVKVVRYFESLQDNRPIRERSLGFVSKKANINRQSLRRWLKDRVLLLAQEKKHIRFKRLFLKIKKLFVT